MQINTFWRARILLAMLLLLDSCYLFLPAQPASAADMEVVITKEQVDVLVYQALWNKAFQGNDALETAIYDAFILQAADTNLGSGELVSAIREFQNKVKQDLHAQGMLVAAPLGNDKPSEKDLGRAMIKIAATIPGLQPMVGKVWDALSGSFDASSGLPPFTTIGINRTAVNDFVGDVVKRAIISARVQSALTEAFDQVQKERLLVGVRQIAGGMVAQNNPALGIPPAILAKIQQDGTILVSLNELKELSKTEFDSLHQSIGEMQKTLSEVDAQQKDLVAYLKDEQQQRKVQEIAAAAAAEHQLELDALRSTASVLSTLVGFVDPKLGKEIGTISNSIIQIADSMNGWLKTISGVGTTDKVAALGAFVVSGNVLNAVMGVVSLFGSSGPTPDQMILEEIGKLRQDVNQLRTEMHDRFDRVDQELNTIYATMQDRFDKIDVQLGKLNAKVDEVQTTLLDLNNKLNRIQRDNYEFLNALGRRPLLEAINGGLGYQKRTGLQMPFQPDFINYENIFQSWATIHAFDPLESGPSQRDYSPGALLNELNAFPIDSNINYLNGWLVANGYPAISNKHLPSPRDWLFATRAYNQLGLEWPQHMKRIDPQRQAQLIAIGDDLVAAMHNLSTLTAITGTQGNHLLFSTVITYYQDKVDRLDQSLQSAVEAPFVQDVQANRLQRTQSFDLYGGIDQNLDYQAPELSNMTCGGTDLSMPAPNNLKALTPTFNRYNLAEYFKLGTISACARGVLLNRKVVCPPKNPDLCEVQGNLKVIVTVSFANTPLTILSVDGGFTTLSDNEDEANYIHQNWFLFQPMFESAPEVEPLSAQQEANRTALLEKTTLDLQSTLGSLQHELDARAVNALSTGSLHPASIELAGAKTLLDSFVTLGLPSAVESDDFLHAMLYGNQQLMDDQQILQSYTLSATQPITATDLTINPRLVIAQKADQRQALLHGLVEKYLDAITAQTYSEPVDYIADANKELEITMLIAQLSEQPSTNPRSIYLPLVGR